MINKTSGRGAASKSIAAVALAAAGLLAAGAAQAHTDIHWSISIPGPIGVAIGSHHPAYVVPAPVYLRPAPVAVYRGGPSWRDADRDGVPDRYDRVYNPRWDRDGDGVPNRHDRHPNHPDDRRGWRGR